MSVWNYGDDVCGYAFVCPQFYNVSFTSTVRSSLPVLTSVCVNGEYDKTAAYGVASLVSVAGKEFTVFSKTGAWVRHFG